MFWCSALHLINVFKHRTVVKHTHTGLQLQLVDAQSGAGQAWKPQWFSILEKHSTKTCTLTRNLSTYVCPPPQPPTDGGRKQTWKNIPAEVTVSGGGEDDHSLATDKWRFAPRLSSAPTTAPQNVFFSRWACMGYLTKIFWFFLRNLPPFLTPCDSHSSFRCSGSARVPALSVRWLAPTPHLPAYYSPSWKENLCAQERNRNQYRELSFSSINTVKRKQNKP